MEGRSKEPCIQAESWAKLSSYDQENKTYKYDKYDVLKATVSSEDQYVYNLNDPDTSKKFDMIATDVMQVIKKSKLSNNKTVKSIEGVVINWLRKEMNQKIDVAIGDFYIKLSKESRVLKISRRTPNSTIAAVYLESSINDISVVIKEKEVNI